MADKKDSQEVSHVRWMGSDRWFLGSMNYLHRLDGPALVRDDGGQEWYQHGEWHRDDGPAVIYPSGFFSWWQHGRRHRVGGPAVVWPDGREQWLIYGKKHRTDGPAVVQGSENEGEADEWWFEGQRFNNAQEYQRSVGLTDEEMTMLILKFGDIK